MKNLIIVVLLFMTFFSCSKNVGEEINSTLVFGNCLKDETAIDDYSIDCPIRELDTMSMCDQIIITKKLKMTPEQMEWFPYYCLDIGDRIYFKNKRGAESWLMVSSKQFVNRNLDKNLLCPDTTSDGGRSFGLNICYPGQLAKVSFTSSTIDFPVHMELTSYGGFEEDHTMKDLANLDIYDESGYRFNEGYGIVLDTMGNIFFDNNQIHSQIEIAGKSFENVYVLNAIFSFGSQSYVTNRYFYTRDQGIVGFIDRKNKEEWHLQ